MKTLEDIIERNIKSLEYGKEMAISNGHEDVANTIQISINALVASLNEYKNQSN